MAIEMYCDHCNEFIEPEVNGGVRLKLGKKEFVFHLCQDCQVLLRNEIKEVFLAGSTWRETG